ncbi:MAG: molybdopterin synthase sulfur carrier subunit [Halieaceae bacterium]|jgi:molybdopterin synthase sulfur carrier subunit
MVRVLFFARIREHLSCAQRDLEWHSAIASVQELRTVLCAEGGTRWQEALFEDNIICAVNQEVVTLGQALCDGDEVAFFPPVTGG